jgi:hypothetical protein
MADVSDPELKSAYEDVRSDANDTNWYAAHHSTHTLAFISALPHAYATPWRKM